MTRGIENSANQSKLEANTWSRRQARENLSERVKNFHFFFLGGGGRLTSDRIRRAGFYSRVPKVLVLSVSILKCFNWVRHGRNNCEISKENTSTSSVYCSRVLSINQYDCSKNAEPEQMRKLFTVLIKTEKHSYLSEIKPKPNVFAWSNWKLCLVLS